jgi:uncharacterized protein (TIGR01244 family)
MTRNHLRSIVLLPIALAVTLCWCAAAVPEGSTGAPGEAVVKIPAIKDLFQTGDIFIGGQPNLEALRWIKSQGVTLIVNLRSEPENKEFTATSFTEENLVKEMGMTYLSLPVGEKDSYAPKTVDKLAEALAASQGKTLIHCASGVRATNLWIAYLVRTRGRSLNEAIAIGKQMKFTFPVEDFLGVKVSFSTDAPGK